MNRLNPEKVIDDLDDAFDVGNHNNGSDMFLSVNADDIPPNTEADVENQKTIDEKQALDEQQA